MVESEGGIGVGVSSRNSEVSRRKFDHPAALDKTRLCVDGKTMLYAFCQEFGVPHKRCGKLLVAVNAAEVDKLAALKAQADANGVTDLIWLSAKEARARSSPCWSPIGLYCRPRPASSTAMPSCWRSWATPRATWRHDRVRHARAILAGQSAERGLMIETGGPAPTPIAAALVVNAASWRAGARALDRRHAAANPSLHLAKGNYFSMSGRSPFSRLIYPKPTPGGLGVLLTLDLAGQAKFGPDVEWVPQVRSAGRRRGKNAFAHIGSVAPTPPSRG